MLEVYFDESERPGGEFCLTGYAFRKSRARAFCAEWQRLFSPFGGVCRMADLNARRGAFQGISRAESASLCVRAVAIINQHAEFGVGVSCDLPEMTPLMPTFMQGFEDVYTYFCDIVLLETADLAGTLSKGGIAYYFESGRKYSGCANRFLSYVATIPVERDRRGYRSHAFVGKEEATPLQAADLLAWEISKHRQAINDGSSRAVRKSLRALLAGTRHEVRHLTGEPLRTAMTKIGLVGLQQVMENAANRRR